MASALGNKFEILENAKQCTGCGACANICRQRAIQMAPNEEGFIHPVIDVEACVSCSQCKKVCPVLNDENSRNITNPRIYAIRADDATRKVSSSGGVFTLASRWVLNQNGAVCGAAFDENMQLRHVMVENEAELDPLRGSKYLQSDVGDIYIRVKDMLNRNRKVLFVGTPCQVAALYRITGKQDNLYTIDILCHGVPSQEVFGRYLSEIANGREVANVKFRSKEFGWVCNHIKIEFADGSSYVGTDRDDAFEIGFLRNLFLRPSCEDCPFCAFPRQGDISVGDFWGIDNFDASQNDGKGTSVVLVNNEKGKKLFDIIKDKTKCKEMNISPLDMPNRIQSQYAHNKNRERFFELINHKKITEAVPMAMNGRYDIGLVSNYCASNFGGALTQYALYHVLEDMGYSTLMIEEPLSAYTRPGTYWDVMDRIFIQRPYPAFAMSKAYKTRPEMKELNQICDTFVVGSDQLFQYSLYNVLDRLVSLDWVETRKKKVAVAASFGHDYIYGEPDVQADLSYWLSRYDYVSTREASGVKLFKDYYGIDAMHILDPVFLADKKHYRTLTDKAQSVLPEKFVGFYILDPSDEKRKIITSLSERLKLDMTGYSEFGAGEDYVKPLLGCNTKDYKAEERLKVIQECDFFVADSFHGICFAIIMQKPFVAFLNQKRGGARFYSILKMFGLENRLVTSYKEFLEKECELIQPINWNDVNSRLECEKEKAMNWLQNALEAPKLNKNDIYDVLDRRISSLEQLRNENQMLRAQLQQMANILGIGYMSSTDLYEYLECICQRKEHLLITITAKDTPGMAIPAHIVKQLKKLGIRTELTRDKHWSGYVAVISRGKVVFEHCEYQKKVEYASNRLGVELTACSAPLNCGNISQTIINGHDYSVNSRGLNFVIYDYDQKQVVDSVGFDTHHHLLGATRR